MSWRSLPDTIPGLWRQIEKIRSLALHEEDRRVVWLVAKALAEMSGQRPGVVYRRILPRDEEQLEDTLNLHDKIAGYTIEEMVKEPFFSAVFLNFEPTSYELEFLKAHYRQQSVLWSRQSGKTTTIGLKLFKFCVRHPASQATITSPGFRQSKLVIRKNNRLALQDESCRVSSLGGQASKDLNPFTQQVAHKGLSLQPRKNKGGDKRYCGR